MRYRSAITGRFVTEAYARRHKRTTVSHKRRARARRRRSRRTD